MADQFVKTYVYLDANTRARLENYADDKGLTVSHAARVLVTDGLDDRITLQEGAWFRLAIIALLRYHPHGNLEDVVREAGKLAKAHRRG